MNEKCLASSGYMKDIYNSKLNLYYGKITVINH